MYLLIRIIYFIFNRLSFETIQSLGMSTGSLMYHLLKSRREVALKNCEAMGIENREQVVRQSFKYIFASYFESFYTHRVDEKFIRERVTLDNRSGLGDDMEGVFIASAHLGGWELSVNCAAENMKSRLAVIGRKLKNSRVNDFIIKQRSSQKVVTLGHRDIANDINNMIDQGVNVAALLDHSATLKDSIFVPFFGIKTSFIKGIPMIAVRKDTPILPAFMVREGKNFKLLLMPEIVPDKTLKPKARIYDVALRINQTYEEVIKQYPDQWYLIHKRFKKIELEDGSIKEDFYQ